MPEIRLRPLADADVPVLARWAEDDVFRLAADWSDGTLAEHEAVFRHSIARPPAELLRLAAVHDGRLVGYIDLHGSAPRVRELGYLIGPSAAWGAWARHVRRPGRARLRFRRGRASENLGRGARCQCAIGANPAAARHAGDRPRARRAVSRRADALPAVHHHCRGVLRAAGR